MVHPIPPSTAALHGNGVCLQGFEEPAERCFRTQEESDLSDSQFQGQIPVGCQTVTCSRER